MKLLAALIYLACSVSAFAQTNGGQIVELSYECQVDIELKLVGRRFIERYSSDNYVVPGVYYQSKAFVFNFLVPAKTKLSAAQALRTHCRDRTIFKADENRFSGDDVFRAEDPATGSITREGLKLASDQSAPKLSDSMDSRILDVERFCKKMVAENMNCEPVKTIVKTED